MRTESKRVSSRFNPVTFGVTFVILFALWLVLSGMFDFFHTSLGVLCTALVAYLSSDLLFPDFRWERNVGVAYRFLRYIPWLFYQIILANIHVVKIALHPKMPMDPAVIHFKTMLTSDLALVTFANSITLTPGTITIDIRDGTYYVHAIDPAVAEDLLTGKEMETRVGHIYLEGNVPAKKAE